ncbi:hypothetical protein MHT86_01960 [Corynebacterium mastitidis]|uniref:hypothetical protein n=1 Tax=Corynebacterium mastitidis TaxID=161890 RepID=UPI0012FE8DA3|nr:hypothetical protein [Corynebacterium mastitidis]MCH6196264.1 hypothetical protein [Corynebacterium mastitidis]
MKNLPKFLAGFFVVILGFFPSASVAEESVDDPGEGVGIDSGAELPGEEELKKMIFSYPGEWVEGVPLFDAEAAYEDGVDWNVIEVGQAYNEMIELQAGTSEGAGFRDLNPTNYGNWCGKNNSGPGWPINSLDQACKNHDICLSQGGATCDCDHNFVSSLRIIRGQYSGWARAYLEAAIIAVPAWHGCRV